MGVWRPGISRLSIFIKLVLIVSAINGCALGTMTLLATIFFRDEAERRVLENNLNIAEVIGSKIRSQFTSLRGISRLMGETLSREGHFTDDTIFEETPNTVLYGLLSKESFIAI